MLEKLKYLIKPKKVEARKNESNVFFCSMFCPATCKNFESDNLFASDIWLLISPKQVACFH